MHSRVLAFLRPATAAVVCCAVALSLSVTSAAVAHPTVHAGTRTHHRSPARIDRPAPAAVSTQSPAAHWVHGHVLVLALLAALGLLLVASLRVRRSGRRHSRGELIRLRQIP